MQRLLLPVGLLVVVLLASIASAGDDPAVLDGSFDEWTTIEPLLVDPEDSPHQFADLGAVKVRVSPRFVDLMIELGRKVNAQRLSGRCELLLDSDGDPTTGNTIDDFEGVDLIVEMTPPDRDDPSRPGMGFGLQVMSPGTPPADPRRDRRRPVTSSTRVSPYDLGIAFAPTYASDVIELRMQRGVNVRHVRNVFTGEQFRMKLVLRHDDQIVDATDARQVPLTVAFNPNPHQLQQEDPIHRMDQQSLRVMSWNVEFGHLFNDPQRFGRVIESIDPDVILFQELTDKHSSEQLTSLLRSITPDRDGTEWTALVGEGGGNLRSAIASRLPLRDIEVLRTVPFPNNPNRTVRAAAAMIEHDNRRVLLGSLHLKCCGSIGSREDETRILEVRAVNAAMKEAFKRGRFDAMILGGDLNLVGARKPLDVLIAELDHDGTALEVVNPMQIDGLSNATWAEPKQPFVPGRLDYIMFSDARLSVARSFVLDSSDVMPFWLREYPLQLDDTAKASDHLPVVVDLVWKDRRASKSKDTKVRRGVVR